VQEAWADGDEERLAALAREPEKAGVMAALVGRPRPWPACLSAAVFSGVARLVATGAAPWPLPVRDGLPAVALAADPAQVPGAAAALQALDRVPRERRAAARGFWERRLTEMLSVLQFRLVLNQEFDMTKTAPAGPPSR
jgi:hypothetical protein